MKVAIALCHPEIVVEGTGVVTQFFRLMEAFSKRRDVEVLPIVNAGAAKYPTVQVGSYRGFKALLLTHPFHLPAISEAEYRRLKLRCPAETVQLKGLLKESLAEHRVDLIHMMDWSRAGIGLAFLQAAKELDMPILYSANDYQAICIRSFMQYREVEPCSGPESARKCALCFNEARSLGLFDRVVRFVAPRVQITSPRTAVMAALVIGRFAPQSLVYEVTGRFEGYIFSRQRSLRDALKGCFRVIGGGEQQQILSKWLGLTQEQAITIWGTVDRPSPNFKKSADAFCYPLKVTFVGRSWPGWGVRFLLQGWKELQISPDIARLFIYTSPGFRQSLKGTWAADLPATPGVEIYEGPIFDRLDQIHRDSSLHVIASQWQDLGSQPADEAKVRKTPLIVPDQYGTRHCVEDGVTGFHYRWRDLESFNKVLAIALSDPERLEAMSQRTSHTRLMEHFVDDLVNEYRKALSAYAMDA